MSFLWIDVNYAYQLCLSDKTKNISHQLLKNTTGAERIEHVDRIITVNLEQLEKNIKFCEEYLAK